MFSAAASSPHERCCEEHRRADEVEVVHLVDVVRVARGAHAQVRADLHDPLAVPGVLAEPFPPVGAALERVPGDRVQGVARRAVREPAPPPDSAPAAEALGHDLPLRDASGRDADTKDLRDHLAIAVRARPEIERAVHGRQRPPDELAPEVGVDGDRPPGSLGSGGEVERVNPSERVGDVDRVRAEVDRRRAGHPVPVDLLADPLQLAELDPPAHVAVLGQRVEDALRRGDVDRPLPRPGHVLRHERLGADPPRERRVPGGPHRRRRERGVRRRAPRQVVAVDEPAARRLSRGAATCEQKDERNREPGPPHEREC